MKCSPCGTLACRICAANWNQISAHGPSYHRPSCSSYIEFPKMQL